jgi:DNA replication protein DnaC
VLQELLLLFRRVSPARAHAPLLPSSPHARLHGVDASLTIDRLLHRAEIVDIAGDSYRLKEAKERAAQKSSSRKRKA